MSDDEVATLSSLEQVDDHPLYTMRYYGAYGDTASSARVAGWVAALSRSWACSLYAALGDGDNMLYGSNSDWEYIPALLLFTGPRDGYASASMVNLTYLGFGQPEMYALTDLPLVERKSLLRAPFLPYDGFNERGLAVGMAAVPPGDVHPDPDKETIGLLMIIREVLDHASDVGEAVTLFQSYNIDMGACI